MMKILLSFVMLGLGVGLSMVADVFIKKSAFKNRKDLYFGSLFYGVVAIPVALSFHYFDFGTLFLGWEALTILLGVALGALMFKEKITANRIVAIILALVALAFTYSG